MRHACVPAVVDAEVGATRYGYVSESARLAPRAGASAAAAGRPLGIAHLDVEHHELGQVRLGERRLERILPEGVRLHLDVRDRRVVEQVDDVGHLRADGELRKLAEVVRRRPRQPHDVVLADGQDLERVRELGLALACLGVDRQVGLGRLVSRRGDALEKRHELFSVRTLVEEEVKPVLHLKDVGRVHVGCVPQNELLHPQKRALVRHLLPHLEHRDPRVLGLTPLAVRALLVADDVLDDEGLLQHRVRDDLLLDRDTQLDAF